MFRLGCVLLLFVTRAWGQQADEGPPISITSPDTASTFVYGTVKSHALVWDRKEKVLSAEITFFDQEDGDQQNAEDTHRFRLPGVTFDEARKVFLVTTARGDKIVVARIKRQLFFDVIEVLPNAVVRIMHPHGQVSVVLEATRPDDPALHPAAAADSTGTHSVDLRTIVQ